MRNDNDVIQKLKQLLGKRVPAFQKGVAKGAGIGREIDVVVNGKTVKALSYNVNSPGEVNVFYDTTNKRYVVWTEKQENFRKQVLFLRKSRPYEVGGDPYKFVFANTFLPNVYWDLEDRSLQGFAKDLNLFQTYDLSPSYYYGTGYHSYPTPPSGSSYKYVYGSGVINDAGSLKIILENRPNYKFYDSKGDPQLTTITTNEENSIMPTWYGAFHLRYDVYKNVYYSNNTLTPLPSGELGGWASLDFVTTSGGHVTINTTYCLFSLFVGNYYLYNLANYTGTSLDLVYGQNPTGGYLSSGGTYMYPWLDSYTATNPANGQPIERRKSMDGLTWGTTITRTRVKNDPSTNSTITTTGTNTNTSTTQIGHAMAGLGYRALLGKRGGFTSSINQTCSGTERDVIRNPVITRMGIKNNTEYYKTTTVDLTVSLNATFDYDENYVMYDQPDGDRFTGPSYIDVVADGGNDLTWDYVESEMIQSGTGSFSSTGTSSTVEEYPLYLYEYTNSDGSISTIKVDIINNVSESVTASGSNSFNFSTNDFNFGGGGLNYNPDNLTYTGNLSISRSVQINKTYKNWEIVKEGINCAILKGQEKTSVITRTYSVNNDDHALNFKVLRYTNSSGAESGQISGYSSQQDGKTETYIQTEPNQAEGDNNDTMRLYINNTHYDVDRFDNNSYCLFFTRRSQPVLSINLQDQVVINLNSNDYYYNGFINILDHQNYTSVDSINKITINTSGIIYDDNLYTYKKFSSYKNYMEIVPKGTQTISVEKTTNPINVTNFVNTQVDVYLYTGGKFYKNRGTLSYTIDNYTNNYFGYTINLKDTNYDEVLTLNEPNSWVEIPYFSGIHCSYGEDFICLITPNTFSSYVSFFLNERPEQSSLYVLGNDLYLSIPNTYNLNVSKYNYVDLFRFNPSTKEWEYSQDKGVVSPVNNQPNINVYNAAYHPNPLRKK
jgi:hypothetical protein